MKVYYVANARMPNEKAHGIQLAKMCEAFVEQGINLELILPRKKNKNKASLEDFYGLRHRIKIKKLTTLNLSEKTRIGFNISALTFALSSFFYLFFKKLKGEKFIVYTIDLDQFSFSLIPFLKRPYFFETHATKRKNKIYRFFLKRVRGVITINSIIKKDLIKKFKLTDNRILVFPNGIDLKMFKFLPRDKAKKSLELPENKYALIYIGRIYDWKGMDILTPTANHLPENHVFYIIGTTETQFRDITGENNIPENIIFLGQKNYQEMPMWESAADVLIQLGTKTHDYSFRQTSPMKLFEYMAVGNPIVASETPAIKEIVSEEEVSFYAPDDPRSFAQAIMLATENKKQIQEKTKNARSKVEKFTWQKRAGQVINLMHSK